MPRKSNDQAEISDTDTGGGAVDDKATDDKATGDKATDNKAPDAEAPTVKPRIARRYKVLIGLVVLGVGAVGIFELLTPDYCRTAIVNCGHVGYEEHIAPILGEEPALVEDIPARTGMGAGEATAIDMPFYGMQYVPEEDLEMVAEFGINTILIDFPKDGTPESWTAQLDQAAAHNMKVVAWQWPPGWEWSDEEQSWIISPEARLFVETVAEHPALLAVYGTHEAYWNECFGCGYETWQLQMLYQQIKEIAEVPVYSSFDGFEFWAEFSPETVFADGICDYCDTWYYPVLDEGYDRNEYIRRLTAEIELFRELAPNSKFVWVIQGFESETAGRKLPNAEQLREIADLALRADTDGVWWYPWTFGPDYAEVLSENPDLHPVVKEAYADFLEETCGPGEPESESDVSAALPARSECK